MSAGRNKNSRTKDRKNKRGIASQRRQVRSDSLRMKRSAKRLKSRMFRLKNTLEDCGRKEQIKREKKVMSLLQRSWDLKNKAKKVLNSLK